MGYTVGQLTLDGCVIVGRRDGFVGLFQIIFC